MANSKHIRNLKKGSVAWNKWRRNATDIEPDLSGADLTEIDIRDCNLMGSNLQNVNLNGNNLSGSDLRGVNLKNANLGNANLSDVNLSDLENYGYHKRSNLTEIDLSSAKISKANLQGCILNKANLTKSFVIESNLRQTDFTDAIFSYSTLAFTDLSFARLHNANFKNASIVKHSNFRSANLSNANFEESKFFWAELQEATLDDARLNGAEIGGLILSRVDLLKTHGLNDLTHRYPSFIDLETMRRAKGQLPIKFLQGCGLSDLEIEFAKLASPGLDSELVARITYRIHELYCGKGIQYNTCFISYNNNDDEIAQKIYSDLQDSGVRCWFAPEDMRIGDPIRKTIGKQIRIHDKLLVIISDDSIRSRWVEDEVEKAIEEEKKQGRYKLFPIRVDDAVLFSHDDWVEKIRLSRNIGNFTKWKDDKEYKKSFSKLLESLMP